MNRIILADDEILNRGLRKSRMLLIAVRKILVLKGGHHKYLYGAWQDNLFSFAYLKNASPSGISTDSISSLPIKVAFPTFVILGKLNVTYAVSENDLSVAV